MSGLLIKEVPPSLHNALKMRAAENRRSMTKEVLCLIESALRGQIAEQGGLPEPFKGKFRPTQKWLSSAKRRGRA